MASLRQFKPVCGRKTYFRRLINFGLHLQECAVCRKACPPELKEELLKKCSDKLHLEFLKQSDEHPSDEHPSDEHPSDEQSPPPDELEADQPEVTESEVETLPPKTEEANPSEEKQEGKLDLEKFNKLVASFPAIAEIRKRQEGIERGVRQLAETMRDVMGTVSALRGNTSQDQQSPQGENAGAQKTQQQSKEQQQRRASSQDMSPEEIKKAEEFLQLQKAKQGVGGPGAGGGAGGTGGEFADAMNSIANVLQQGRGLLGMFGGGTPESEGEQGEAPPNPMADLLGMIKEIYSMRSDDFNNMFRNINSMYGNVIKMVQTGRTPGPEGERSSRQLSEGEGGSEGLSSRGERLQEE